VAIEAMQGMESACTSSCSIRAFTLFNIADVAKINSAAAFARQIHFLTEEHIAGERMQAMAFAALALYEGDDKRLMSFAEDLLRRSQARGRRCSGGPAPSAATGGLSFF